MKGFGEGSKARVHRSKSLIKRRTLVSRPNAKESTDYGSRDALTNGLSRSSWDLNGLKVYVCCDTSVLCGEIRDILLFPHNSKKTSLPLIVG